MKLQLDTENKTIKVEGTVSIDEFMKVVKKLLPNDWKQYKLESNTVIYNWTNPIVIDWPNYPYAMPLPIGWPSYRVTCGVTDNSTGVVNFEISNDTFSLTDANV